MPANFLFYPFSSLGNCPYNFFRYHELRYLELSPCRILYLVHSAFFLGLFFHQFSRMFLFNSFECWKNTFGNLDQIFIFSYFHKNRCRSSESLKSKKFKREMPGFERLRKWSNKKVAKKYTNANFLEENNNLWTVKCFSLLLPLTCLPFASQCTKHSISFIPMKSQDFGFFYYFFCYPENSYHSHRGARSWMATVIVVL